MRNQCRLSFSFLLLLSPIRGDDPKAEEIDRFLAAWSERMADLRTLEVRFTQEKRLKILRRPLLSRGTIYLSVPEKRLRCVVLDPLGKVESEVIAGEGVVQIYYPALRRVEVFELGAGTAPPLAFPGLGGDVASLKRDHRLSLERVEGGDRLTLTPRDASSPIREMKLLLSDYRVKEMSQMERSGDSIRLTIEELKENRPLGPRDLILALPPGVEEVRPLEKIRPPASPDPGGAAPSSTGSSPRGRRTPGRVEWRGWRPGRRSGRRERGGRRRRGTGS